MNSPKEKVLFLITKATWGGAQKYVFDLATNLQKKGFVVGVAYGTPGLLAEKLDSANIATYPISSLQRDVSVSSDIKSLFEIYRIFKKESPDIVHLNSSKASSAGALAARLAGVPRILYTVHGWPFLERRNIFIRVVIWMLSWVTALLCDTIIVVSDYDLRLARPMPFVRNKMVRIYNGIAPMRLGSGDVVRHSFPKGAHITGTIGELTKNKNQIALIEEARNNQEMHVAIVGDGEDRDYLQKKIETYGLQKRVKLFGFIPASEALPGFDIFALPSVKEGLPYVLIEAKRAGLPIVANRVGGVGEILDAKDMSEFSIDRMVEETIALYR